MVFTLESRITKLWGFPLLFCEQLTYLCLRSNWPRLSRPPIYRKVCCWLSWWKNSSHPLWHFLYYLFSIQSRVIASSSSKSQSLFSNQQQPKSSLWERSQSSRLLVAIFQESPHSLRLWNHQVYSKTKTKTIMVSKKMAIRLDKVKDTLNILENKSFGVIFTSKYGFSKQSYEVRHIEDNYLSVSSE